MKPLELHVEPGAVTPYRDPTVYRQLHAGRNGDVPYYVRLCRRLGGSVLECGCGNGRVSLPLARAGLPVTGVDRSQAMLDDLRARLREELPEVRRRVDLHAQDMRQLSLSRHFSVVIAPFDTFCHLYNRQDVEMFLRGVRQHLTRDGRLVFDVHLSTPDELSRIGDYDVMAQVSRRPLEGSRRIQISQRHYHPEEVLVLLRHNGFEHVRLTADYTGRALDERAKRMVVSARPS